MRHHAAGEVAALLAVSTRCIHSVRGAGGRGRTGMRLPPKVFETFASAYSATPACAAPHRLWRYDAGAEDEIRTRDPLLGKEVLYH
jgi:hypothetical protein